MKMFALRINEAAKRDYINYMGGILKSIGGKPQDMTVIAPEPIVKSKLEDLVESKIKSEKVASALTENVKQFQNKEAKYEAKIEFLKKKAKDYLEADKKKQARKVLEEVGRLQKHLSNIEIRRKVVANKKDELEVHDMNREVIDAIESAQNIMSTEDLSDKLQEQLIREKMNEQMKQFAQNDSENEMVDELFEQLQRDVAKEKRKQVEKKNPVIGIQPRKVVNNSSKPQQERDQIQQLLDAL